MQGCKVENIDCFYYQYNHCTNGQCKFQHRDSCKDSSETCVDWFRHRKCRNQKCPRKHLSHETIVTYFLCKAEKTENHCTQLNCPMYHEKARQFIEYGTIPPNSVPMVSAVKKKRMVDLVKLESPQVQNFVVSGYRFLDKVRLFIANSVREHKLAPEKGRTCFKEILHTILFCGSINDPIIEPKSFFGKEEEFDQLFAKYPDVFQKYNTELPTRPPYTVLLDAVVEIMGTRNADEVLKCLLDLSEQMMVPTDGKSSICRNVFVSTVINYCYFWNLHITNEKTDNYFGASVSCKGRQQTEIMIDILCCQTWHKYIGLAVCIGNWYKNQVILFPPNMHSIAYNITFTGESPSEPGIAPNNQHEHTVAESGGIQNTSPLKINTALRHRAYLNAREPCERCLTIFPNIIYHPDPASHAHPHWEYGNCAECESLSQLLCAHPSIATRLSFYVQRSLLQTPNEQIALPEGLISRKWRRLTENLRSVGFNVGDHLSFYDPSAIDSTALEIYQN
ncbi:uncharacterized protein [Scyliorhinus torazame]|uniref:uncharacterized protein n=1 Tax=Scyliorhinus torazame TaxID=75743 RepID=UPI003B5B5C19